jgi:hypothetical protein
MRQGMQAITNHSVCMRCLKLSKVNNAFTEFKSLSGAQLGD